MILASNAMLYGIHLLTSFYDKSSSLPLVIWMERFPPPPSVRTKEFFKLVGVRKILLFSFYLVWKSVLWIRCFGCVCVSIYCIAFLFPLLDWIVYCPFLVDMSIQMLSAPWKNISVSERSMYVCILEKLKKMHVPDFKF